MSAVCCTRTALLAVLLGIMGPAAQALTQIAPSDQQTEAATIQGEVVDPSTYLQEGRHGPELAEQTYEAVDGGQTLALLEDGSNTLYLLIAEQPGEDPNELVYDYVNQQVKATGRVYQRGGVRGVVLSTVTPIEPAAALTPPASPATPAGTQTP